MNLTTITPISKFRTDAPAMLDQLEDSGQPMGLTQHGVVKAVIMSAEAYQKMCDTKNMLQLVAMADGDIRGGRHRLAEDGIIGMRAMIADAKTDRG